MYNEDLSFGKNLGIYIHYPWCLQKCHYCDFYSVGLQGASKTQQDFENDYKWYFEGLERELGRRLYDSSCFKNFSKVETVFFGGGTPSLLPVIWLEKILKLLRHYFLFSSQIEISLEGNPENITPSYLQNLYDVGVNRVNVGLQSFQSQHLKNMNRYYSEERYQSILSNLSQGPIQNYGIDLMYGFPKQTQEEFLFDLNRVLSHTPKHLSLYSLTVEEGTFYGQAVRQKKMSLPEEELQFQIWESLPSLLTASHLANKYEQYEVSNFALNEGSSGDKYRCKHNLRYWHYEAYMGLGPGAHGFDGVHRYANPRNIQAWMGENEKEEDSSEKKGYELHQPYFDFPLMFLRLNIPWKLKFWELRLEGYGFGKNKVTESVALLKDWVAKDKASIIEGGEVIFQWKGEGMKFLDEHILEMQNLLAN